MYKLVKVTVVSIKGHWYFLNAESNVFRGDLEVLGSRAMFWLWLRVFGYLFVA